MKPTNLAQNIAALRKAKGITQEQMAAALNLSPQAISKWETDTSQPDTQTIPLIADFFGVSIDYLFYGKTFSYDDLYDQVFRKVAAHPQMSEESYTDALTVFGHAHHGISCGNLRPRDSASFPESPVHIANEGGVSLFSGRGYGAILTRSFFAGMTSETAAFAATQLEALADETRLQVCMAVLSMSDISFGELQEKLHCDEATLRNALDPLLAAGILVEKPSKHQALGVTYDIQELRHTCLCLLLATLEMQRATLQGHSCCMGYGDYPIPF